MFQKPLTSQLKAMHQVLQKGKNYYLPIKKCSKHNFNNMLTLYFITLFFEICDFLKKEKILQRKFRSSSAAQQGYHLSGAKLAPTFKLLPFSTAPEMRGEDICAEDGVCDGLGQVDVVFHLGQLALENHHKLVRESLVVEGAGKDVNVVERKGSTSSRSRL